jgi:NAD(P)-dependent dehydrogenase (short-subunit alcohol dehydrogenase family)
MVNTEAFLPLLNKSSSSLKRVVYVSSDLGSVTSRTIPSFPTYRAPFPIYRMSKAALDMLAMCDAIALQQDGIKVGAYNPGYAVTGLGNTGNDHDAVREQRMQQGGRDSVDSARGLVEVLEGKRDDDFLKGIVDVDGGVIPLRGGGCDFVISDRNMIANILSIL